MVHLLIAVWAADRGAISDFVDDWAPTAAARSDVCGCTVSVALPDQGRFGNGDPVDVLLALEFTPDVRAGDIPAPERLVAVARRLEAWQVEPHRPIVSEEPTTVKMVSFVARAAHLTHDEFARHWTEQHAPLARRHHVGLVDYTQNVVTRALKPECADVAGIAELRFRTRDDFEQRFYDSDEGREIIRRDVQRFIARPSNNAALMREQRYDVR